MVCSSHREYDFNEAELKVAELASQPMLPAVPLHPTPMHPVTADIRDIETATIQGFSYILNSETLLQEAGAQAALKGWVQLLAMTHPVSMCKKGSVMLASNFDQVWPESAHSPRPSLGKFHVCGKKAQPTDWHGCQGSRPNTRGYTCGLWQLLHATTVNLPEDGGQFWVASMKGYISNFFQCSLCAHHFTLRISKDDAAGVRTRRDAVLWLWRVHNEVNRRLANEEEKYNTGDPQFPKTEWPPQQLCPDCQKAATDPNLPIAWNEDQVVPFILRYYGAAPAHHQASSLKQEISKLHVNGTGSVPTYHIGGDPIPQTVPTKFPSIRATGGVADPGGSVRLAGRPGRRSSSVPVLSMATPLHISAGLLLVAAAYVALERLRSFRQLPRSAASSQ